MLEKAFAGQNIGITSRTRDGSLMLVKVDSDVNPGEYYIFDVNTKKADFLWANSSWIDPRLMRPMEAIEVRARDGVTLKGYLTLPAENLWWPLIPPDHCQGCGYCLRGNVSGRCPECGRQIT